MKRQMVQELHYITPVVNLESIITKGILSHENALRIPHTSVAEPSVQRHREKIILPNGQPLHRHVNLYFDARNPMMYVRKDHHRDLVVIAVSPSVLDLPGVMISDGNAAVQFGTRFALPNNEGFALLDEGAIYAKYWTDPDPLRYTELKRKRCAEVLVPGSVAPSFLERIYCSCTETSAILTQSRYNIDVVVLEQLFFL